MYPGIWKVMYKQLHINGGEFVLNIEMQPYVWRENNAAFGKLTHLYEGMLRHECDHKRMNEFMQELVDRMDQVNMRNIIGKLSRRAIISKILGDKPIKDIVGEYIPSE